MIAELRQTNLTTDAVARRAQVAAVRQAGIAEIPRPRLRFPTLATI
jgi:hypothetical protein